MHRGLILFCMAAGDTNDQRVNAIGGSLGALLCLGMIILIAQCVGLVREIVRMSHNLLIVKIFVVAILYFCTCAVR